MQNKNTIVDWPHLVLQKGFILSIEKMCIRRFGRGVSAEECTTYVIEKLAEDDWQRCNQFQGRSKPTTLLCSLASN